MPSHPSVVHVVYQRLQSGEFNLIEAHTTEKGAQNAAAEYGVYYGYMEVELKKANKGNASDGKVKTPKKGVDYGEGQDELAGDDDDLPVATGYVDGALPNALRGLKVLFTGTMEKKRTEMEEVAETYGAEIVKKLDETDYIVVGTKPGDKKIREIKQKNLDTVTESGFFDMLKTGVPREKRERMLDGAAQEPPAKKQKK